MTERGRGAGRSHNHAFANSLRAIATLTLVLSGTIGTGRVAAASASVPAAQTARAAALSEGRVVTASTAAQRAVPLASSTPHIMLVVEENEGYSDIIGSSSAPYINSLANTYASATKWYAVQHNSPHDYLDLIVGSDLGLPNGKPYSNTTLVDELHNAGIPWKSYMESMPSNCFTGTTSNGLYDPNHNPFHYFKNYTGSCGLVQQRQPQHGGRRSIPRRERPRLRTRRCQRARLRLPRPQRLRRHARRSGFGSPCADSSNSQLIKAGDTWLSATSPPVLSSTWFKQNGIVIITWDEALSDSSGCCGLSSPADTSRRLSSHPGMPAWAISPRPVTTTALCERSRRPTASASSAAPATRSTVTLAEHSDTRPPGPSVASSPTVSPRPPSPVRRSRTPAPRATAAPRPTAAATTRSVASRRGRTRSPRRPADIRRRPRP